MPEREVHAGNAPGLSVVIPVHNEAAIVEHTLGDMLAATTRLGVPFELLVCENGSIDETLAIVRRLHAGDSRIRVETLPVGDYGKALQHAMRVAHFDQVVIFNLDYWSAEFLQTALDGLATHDMVIGSKVLGRDRRPLLRRLITRSFNLFLRVCFGFRGTDTHGMKALRRGAAGLLAAECVSHG
jgi:glycosyltransferase involved in cell wall biosynthesis